jgi:hypothetical protein
LSDITNQYSHSRQACIVKPHLAWSIQKSEIIDDGMSFSPWHGIAAHQPLGSIMRKRKMTYEASVKFHAKHNRHQINEPKNLDTLDNLEIVQ